jgi:hypothetical protein
MKRLIHKKQLNVITSVEFSYKDVTVLQEGSLVVLEKDEIIELARMIENEKHDLEFYKRRGNLHAN